MRMKTGRTVTAAAAMVALLVAAWICPQQQSQGQQPTATSIASGTATGPVSGLTITVSRDTSKGATCKAYGFSFGVCVTVTGDDLTKYEIHQLINSSTTMKDWTGVAMTRAAILALYTGSTKGVDTNGKWVTDDDWDWQPVLATLHDDQVANIHNIFVVINGTQYTQIYCATKTRAFKIEIRDKATKAVVAKHEWSYGWDNDNAVWKATDSPPAPTTCCAGSHIGTGDITNVQGITGIPWW